ncbi:MAG: orotate phosphoribosyltransferase [Burkholderiales bacterium]|nr:orotate phosphoribosyltransferase [Burkholderiales bacterium]
MSPGCALSSWRHTTSAFCNASQSRKPLATAERIPFTLREMMRMLETQIDQGFGGEFIEFAIERGVLRFGEFKTKAGRLSPYFFNAGLFNDGQALRRLGQFYAKAILSGGIDFDLLFGPAYKGIPLVTATAVALDEMGRNVPICFNRKEAKDHGEGGLTIGAPLAGRTLIIDDVISAGTSVRESVQLIGQSGAHPCGVVIALDRMERGSGEMSAVQEVQKYFNIPVLSIATLDDLVGHLQTKGGMARELQMVAAYRTRYGAPLHVP